MKKTGLIFSLLIVSLLLTHSSIYAMPSFGLKTVVIDPGHGGKDPGCHGNIHKEKDVALAVGLKLGNYIKQKLPDVNVVYTRSTDIFIPLQSRADIANKANADLFISIHCNAACYRDKNTKKDVCNERTMGTETYVMDIKNEEGNLGIAQRENEAILYEEDYVEKVKGFDPQEAFIIMSIFNNNYLTHSLDFASKIQRQFGQRVGRKDRGVKRASLWVLWRTSMPSVLTEIGYLTNPSEELYLGSEQGQDYIASGLFRAVRDYKVELEGGKTTKPVVNEPKIEEKAPIKPTKQDDTVHDTIELVETSVKIENKPKDRIVYKVQFLSYPKKIPINDQKFTKLANVGYYIHNGIYKYTIGEFDSREKATAERNIIRQLGYNDAFVIKMKNGKRIIK